MSTENSIILCTVCGTSYASNRARYHERTCTRTTAEVKYPDPLSDKPGAVTDEVLVRDPVDRKFYCIYCPDFGHKDVEAIKNHCKLCKNAKLPNRIKAAPALQLAAETNLAPTTSNETTSTDLHSSPSSVFNVGLSSTSVRAPTSSPLTPLSLSGSPVPIVINNPGASVMQDHVTPTALKRPVEEPTSSPPSKRHAHPSNSPTDRTIDLPPIDQHLGSNWTSSPGNPPSNHPSSSPLNGSFNASQSSTSSSSPLSHSQTRIIDMRILSIHQSLHILTSTCTACYVRGLAMEYSHTVDSCPHDFANDTDLQWRSFRAIFKKMRGGCYGCSVPNSIWFTDQMNQHVRLAHRGIQGGQCLFNQTFRQLVYSVFHCEEVKELFRSSGFNTGGLELDELNPTHLQHWLVRVNHLNRPLTNLLTVVEFVISLRGLPVENPDIPAIWLTEHE